MDLWARNVEGGFPETGPRKIKDDTGKLTTVEFAELHDVSRISSLKETRAPSCYFSALNKLCNNNSNLETMSNLSLEFVCVFFLSPFVHLSFCSFRSTKRFFDKLHDLCEKCCINSAKAGLTS